MRSIKIILLFITSSSSLFVGVDISHAELFESRGVIYQDEKGQSKDLFKLIKTNRINHIRLRLFTANEEQAKRDPDNYGHTLNLTLKLARRAKRYSLGFLLNFHYSDTWADLQHQIKPIAWTDLTFDQLNSSLYNYTRDSLRAFVQQNTTPQYIQIGNEITHGMLWPDAYIESNGNWTNFITLLHTASLAIRMVLQNKTKIVIHITSSTDCLYTKRFFDNMIRNIDFDIIGLSYYPVRHGTLNALRSCLEQIARDYDKSIFIVETNYPWNEDEYASNKPMKDITGFEETPAGQIQYIEYLADILNNLTKKTSLFWYATEYVATKTHMNLDGFDRRSFFNSSGIALPILRAFGELGQPKRRMRNPVSLPSESKNSMHWFSIFFVTTIGILFIYRKCFSKRYFTLFG